MMKTELTDEELAEMMALRKKWDEEEKLRRRIASNKWRYNNPEDFKRSMTKSHLKRKYNLTLEDYDDLLLKQDNKCAICETDTPGGDERKKRFYVDHDHATGKVRNLLCHRCNSTISNHSAEHLRKCADYVEFWALKHYNTEE